MPKKRVIAWGSGYLGTHGLRQIIAHPGLELVGMQVWSAGKVGQDAGVLAGGEPIGVIATNDHRALLDLKADCIIYFASTVGRDEDAVAEVVPFLEAGTNVVSISHFDLQYPKYGRPELVDPIVDACARGGSSFLITGEEPGFAFGQHLFTLLSTFGRVDGISIIEMSMVQLYAGRDSLLLYGFNGSPQEKPPMFTDQVGAAWHLATLRGIADFVGVEIDDITQSWDAAASDHPVETAAFGTVDAGRTTGARWTVQAHVGGRPFLTYQKILRLSPDVAPHWPSSALGIEPGVVHKIEIEGDVAISEEVFRPKRGISATPTIAVNAAPFVCDTVPGVILQQHLPIFPPAAVRR
jgi:4-hydroxy-tetrahydrodipicolinate reductase